jgi:TRAP transporter TAXI family solute receptor
MNLQAEKSTTTLPVQAVAGLVLAAIVLVGGFFGYRWMASEASRHHVVIATGSEGGTYHALGEALARVLEQEQVVESASAIVTEGSVANMQYIEDPDGSVDLAFVQSDTDPGSDVELVAPLYDEVLHIVVRKDLEGRVESLFDLRTLRVALGTPGSGTRQLSERVLDHFGVVPAEDLALAPSEAAAGLLDGSVDAAFLLTAIPSRIVEQLAEADAVRFLTLGDAQEYGNEADGLALVFPSIESTTIPRSTYTRLPRRPIRTISVSALLIARQDLDEGLVRAITQTIFENRAGTAGLEGEDLVVAHRIREDYRPGAFAIPYHAGAEAYYDREQPPFFVEYAEAMSFGFTLLVAAYSGIFAVRQWMRRKMKDRVDAYLIEVDRLAADLGNLTLGELRTLRDQLEGLRQRAFSDLVQERLYADEAFTIFQNHLGQEFSAIEARIEEKKHTS